MGWDPVNIKVPRPAPDPITGQKANDPGYCFLTFPSQSQAASVLTQVNGAPSPLVMPNSAKAFSLTWASSVPSAPLPANSAPGIQTVSIPFMQYTKEIQQCAAQLQHLSGEHARLKLEIIDFR